MTGVLSIMPTKPRLKLWQCYQNYVLEMEGLKMEIDPITK